MGSKRARACRRTIRAVDALAPPTTPSWPWPDEIGGYEVLEVLSGGGESALAVAPGNRRVVLKLLDEDCLMRGGANPKLHPGIRDRLARVRELAHIHVANLHGVEHDAGRVYQVWEFVDGVPLEEWSPGSDDGAAVAAQDLLLVARELILTVEALHARGIVHGAIHGRNVIIDNTGRVKLVHVSPLLYTDARHDLASIAELFGKLADRHGEAGHLLEALASEAAEADGSLRSMGSRAASLIDLRRDEEPDEIERRADRRRRSASRFAAATVVVGALALSYGVKQYVRRVTPHPPAPPEAPPAAME
jgi:hypothetical protein